MVLAARFCVDSDQIQRDETLTFGLKVRDILVAILIKYEPRALKRSIIYVQAELCGKLVEKH